MRTQGYWKRRGCRWCCRWRQREGARREARSAARRTLKLSYSMARAALSPKPGHRRVRRGERATRVGAGGWGRNYRSRTRPSPCCLRAPSERVSGGAPRPDAFAALGRRAPPLSSRPLRPCNQAFRGRRTRGGIQPHHESGRDALVREGHRPLSSAHRVGERGLICACAMHG